MFGFIKHLVKITHWDIALVRTRQIQNLNFKVEKYIITNNFKHVLALKWNSIFFQRGNIVGKSEIKCVWLFKKFDFPSALKNPQNQASPSDQLKKQGPNIPFLSKQLGNCVTNKKRQEFSYTRQQAMQSHDLWEDRQSPKIPGIYCRSL